MASLATPDSYRANELSNWNGTPISYDLIGNMLSDGSNTLPLGDAQGAESGLGSHPSAKSSNNGPPRPGPQLPDNIPIHSPFGDLSL
jgi:hypothetical protein